MAQLRGLSVKVPIRFSEKAQKELYETCVAYKELAETRGAENDKLRELVQYILDENYGDDWFYIKAKEIGLEARC